MHASRYPYWLVALPLLLVLACSSDADSAQPSTVPETMAPTATAEPTPNAAAELSAAIDQLTVDDLPALAFPERQLESFEAVMGLSARSGPVSNEEAAKQFPTTGLTTEALDRSGRIGGYLHAFDSPSFGSYNGGPASVETGLELFRHNEAAIEYVDARWNELSLSDPVLGITIGSTEEFEVATHGESSGRVIVATYDAYSAELAVTIAFLRLDNLLAWISVVEFDPFDRTAYVARLLEVYEQRLERILSGEIEATSADEIPTGLPAALVPAPLDGPRYDAMILTASDTPAPAHYEILADGYVADPDLLILYQRLLKDRGLAKLTGLTPHGIRASVMKVPDATGISSYLDRQRSAGPETLEAIAFRFGLANPGVNLHELDHGDQALVLVVTGEHEVFGAINVAYAWIQVDDVLSELYAIAPTSRLSVDDVDGLAELAAARLTTALAAS